MKTLYDLLGALPEDDAESLRAAFRKAVKATHPDTNADDPGAALRFRQILRANAILSDARQRAAYDHLLALTLQQSASKPKSKSTAGRIRKLAIDATTIALVSSVSIGGYLLLDRLSKASVVSQGAVEVAARAPADNVAAAPTPQFDSASREEPPDKTDREETAGAGITNEAIAASAVASGTSAGEAPANASAGPAPDLAVKDARSYWKRGIIAYRDGDLSGAIAAFDRAISLDPSFADAYVDRGTAFYRLREFDRAFADLTRVKRMRNSSQSRTAGSGPPRASPASGRN